MSRPSATFSSFAGGTMIAGSSSAETFTLQLQMKFIIFLFVYSYQKFSDNFQKIDFYLIQFFYTCTFMHDHT